MTPKTGKFNPVPLSDQSVELVSGPLCGKSFHWRKGVKEEYMDYYGGVAVYRYEGPSPVHEDGRITAVHVGG